MKPDLQPILEQEHLILYPLEATDFEALYQVASDPGIWEQHPNKDRWKREVFSTFFEGAMLSNAAFRIVDKRTGKIIGSTRFYDHNEEAGRIFIGYTFYDRAYWGTGANPAVKAMMLDYAFGFAEEVALHVGAENIRSQIAVTRIGAKKTGEEKISYYGEPPQLNFIYSIYKNEWKGLPDRKEV